nr:cylicin-2 [Dasypus novemcinctus]XP_058161140.1 cylicin-2 [Dasypus novemcinctus]XP_058161141.1 cylicin-2 [Dasypus novemcinctus]XP_058161142.1 cylicin-2 [Dasypus novemcinctus]XP_058161143.1 cylicin-2 [Dasypus novemcinctus]XP_058161144.1 cylicin-2 [Dasypus novemcinctus]XP_058161145.1 cylicin-2 [Dasypus novemcinctus]XP_058161146.1 cylicin-2 [Dasypus novemcinctus]XP_058161147.1 cylicin-2 [Dasypus novemcinctus]XP_058161148.1 cylicin-2 [Dasypus novemcinctus]XP_058161149.1 cylicin-2 [Dasypus n
MARVKMWIPWNGLVVIGKKMELLGRITPKPRSYDEKPGSEFWRPDAAQKADLLGKWGPTQERMDVKLLHNLASAWPASAGLEEGSPGEIWGKQEVKREIGAESEGSGTAPASRRGSGFEESLRSTEEKVGTRGEGVRSRGEKLGARGEKERSIGEKISSEEKLGTSEDLRFREYNGEEQRSSAENLRSSGERLGSKGERRGSREERRWSKGERRWSKEERRGSKGERQGSKGERRWSKGERRWSKGERRGSKGERRGSVGEKHRSSKEKVGLSGEKLKLSGEELGSSGDLRSIGDKLGSSGEKLGSRGEELGGSRTGNISEEEIREVLEVTDDEKVVEMTDEEVDIPFERVEGSDEKLEGTAEGEEVEGAGLHEEKDISDESISMEEKGLLGKGTSE